MKINKVTHFLPNVFLIQQISSPHVEKPSYSVKYIPPQEYLVFSYGNERKLSEYTSDTVDEHFLGKQFLQRCFMANPAFNKAKLR
jgi:hypothetical protein